MENKTHCQVLEGSSILFEFSTDSYNDALIISILNDLIEKRESFFYSVRVIKGSSIKEYRLNSVDGTLIEKIIE